MTPIERIRKACVAANPEIEAVIWACDGCKRVYGEYVNGCPNCWDVSLTREENLKRYPNRSVRAHNRPLHLADVLLAMKTRDKESRGLNFKWIKMIRKWNLRADSLDQQSPECIAFLDALLSK